MIGSDAFTGPFTMAFLNHCWQLWPRCCCSALILQCLLDQ